MLPNDSFLSLKNTYLRRLKLKINDHFVVNFLIFIIFLWISAITQKCLRTQSYNFINNKVRVNGKKESEKVFVMTDQ